MKKSILFCTTILTLITAYISISFAQLIKPKAHGTPSEGPTIEQAQKEDYMGPKARVAVTRFENKSAKGSFEIGDGLAEMLAHALFATNRFIVLERQAIGDVLVEQDFGASGRVKQETAPGIGEIEGAEILIMGTITEFEPGSSGMGGEVEKQFDLPGHITRRVGDVLGAFKGAGKVKTSHLALIIKMVDAKTGRRIASEQIEGKATDIEGLAGLSRGTLAGSLSGYSNTPMEKAIRIAIDNAVKLVVAKTPERYYRVLQKEEIQPASLPPPSISPPPVTNLSSGISMESSSSGSRIVYVKWPKVSLRDGPGMNFKSLMELQKGTVLDVIEEKGSWIRVRLEDGQEGWVGKATVSENP